MAKHMFLVFSNPAPGRESDYNRWYDEVHLREVLSVPGFTGASRYRIAPQEGEAPEFGYLAAYEIDADDPQPVLGELVHRAETGILDMSDALGDVKTLLVEQRTRVEA